MNNIKDNPYRVLGVIANARMKEIQKNISRINSYLSIGKEITLLFDNDNFGSIIRNESTINSAKKMLQLDSNKLEHALFWFVNENEIDDIAIEHIKKGNIDKSNEIWQKIVSKSAINNTNYSAYNNLSTLLFLKGEYKKAVKLKSGLIESNSINVLGKLVCDDNYLFSNSALLNAFIESMLSSLTEIGKKESEIIEICSDSSQVFQDLVSSQFVSEPISNLDKAINESISLNKKGMSEGKFKNLKGREIGKKLMNNTKKDISKLKKILGANHFKYKLYADKLAIQLEQCGIAYYNATMVDYDYLYVYEYALNISVGENAKSKLSNAIKHTKENEKLNTCWFCGKNKIVDGCEARFQMHKWEIPSLSSDPFSSLLNPEFLNQNRKYTFFKDGGFPLSRCRSCFKRHEESVFSKAFNIFNSESRPTIKGGDNKTLRNHPEVIKKIKEGYEPGLPS